MGQLGDELADKIILHDHCDCTESNREMRAVMLDIMKLTREIHKMVSNADMRARLAFGEATEANDLVNKNQKDIKFLIGIKNNFKNKTGGINV